jgi:hypothetical protein
MAATPSRVNASGHLFVSSDQTYRSTDQGATWKALPVGFPNVTNFTENSKKELFVTSGGFAYQTLYRSSDFGNNWLPMNTGVVGIPNVGFYGDTILVGDNYYNAKMFRSTDNGATFKNVSGMTVISGYINALIGTRLPVDHRRHIHRYLSKCGPWESVEASVECCRNISLSTAERYHVWFPFCLRRGNDPLRGQRKHLDRNEEWNGEHHYLQSRIRTEWGHLCGNGRSIVPLDGCRRSVGRIDTQKTGKPYGIYIAVNRDGKLFTGGAKNGTNSETYQSTNGGVSWSMIQNNITSMDNSANFRSLFVASNGRLFAGTTSGLFRSSSVTTDIARTSAAVAAAFELAPNYPNPFNPSTTIGFTLDVSGVTSLKIFDALGREVAVLADGYLEAGVYHQRTFHATHLSSGMYVAQLMNGQRTQFRKMLLMK